MLRRVNHGHANPVERNHLRRVKHAEAHARREQPLDRSVNFTLLDEPVVHGVDECDVLVAAGGVGSGAHRHRGTVRVVGRVLMASGDVSDGAAVRGHIALELPVIAQDLLEQEGARAGRHAVHGVVGAHDGIRAPFDDGGPEGGKVGVPKIARRHVDVETVPLRFRPAVHGVVLGRGHGLQVSRIVTLQSPHKGDSQLPGQEGVFTVRFLAASPARIAKDIDVGRPERQSVVDAVIAFALRLVVLGAGFGGNDLGLATHEINVPGSCHGDGLRKHRRVARARHAVQRLVPPIVGRDAQPGNGRSGVLHLQDLLLERQARDKIVNPLFNWQGGILEGKARRPFFPRRRGRKAQGQADHQQKQPESNGCVFVS